MSAPRRNGNEGSGGRRLYKLVGALVVALVIAVALVPLWLGGGDEQRTRLVEVQPETLNHPGEEGAGSEGPQGPDDSERETPSEEGSGKWWQAEDSGTDSAEPEAGEETAPTSPSGEPGEPGTPSGAVEEEELGPAQGTGDGPAAPEADAPAPEEEAVETADEGSSAPRDDVPEVTEGDQKAEAEGPYWTVMVGSFQDPANARGLKDRLGEQGYAAEVVIKTIEGQKWRRVYAGREGSQEKAEQVLTRLKQAGYDDLLVVQAE